MITAPDKTRKLRLELMTRVEGEGGITVELHDGKLKDITIDIFEPPRLFESFLRGRSIEEVPDIVARICGICPAAYQFTASQAIESALGVSVPTDLRQLRLLLYLGEWIQSHALHIYLLQAPDLLGAPDAIELARDHRQKVQDALRLKKIGNRVMDVVGGRSVHPINVCIGGFYRAPSTADVRALHEDLAWALDASFETLEFVKTLAVPKLDREAELVALSHPEEYAVLDGTLTTAKKRGIAVRDFPKEFTEVHFAHSNALHSRHNGAASYFVGPLARVTLNREQLSPLARKAASELFLSPRNPYAGVLARSIELIHCCETTLAIVDSYREPALSRVPYVLKAGEGQAASEAPRGTLYHQYRFDHQGLVEFARIVPPTAQNFSRMEDDLRLLVPTVLDRTDAEILAACEQLVRCYDPCISCSVHAVRIKRV